MSENQTDDESGPIAPIRVFLVDDHGVVRRGMRAYLEMLDDMAVVGEAGDGQQALERLAALDAQGQLPDVVMMDLLMPRLDGIAATAAIKQRYPIVEVVALTSFIEESEFLPQSSPPNVGYARPRRSSFPLQ